MTEPDITPEDALQVAQRAMSRCSDLEDDVAELEEENLDLKERLTALELRYREIDEQQSYDSLDRDGRVGRVREHAYQRAVDGHGKASLDYNAIMWEVFDGEPSADYCYKLMKLAANAPGFEYHNPTGKGKKLTVDAREARTGASFSSAKKTDSEGVL
ncbi:hypothetical protein HTZ84_05080 [Haloterrigena sp. SYSU A558-1]|uniref:Uncharacterized protein n=1 Tax=Haloterrigena gelatinilytica TaxID=2741724 RepID=A0ABX2LG33_9EURY|nr:hypothetical protein [Haloterrigena gelatinilytica]NUC71686.1 hypothetical protein [Haloterrigena gelatinilytica]